MSNLQKQGEPKGVINTIAIIIFIILENYKSGSGGGSIRTLSLSTRFPIYKVINNDREMKNYPNDLSDSQWQVIKNLIDWQKKEI